ncbi:MAG: 2-oxoacid:acceptor oxidoreductase subunit alpha [Rhodoplanes sp.]
MAGTDVSIAFVGSGGAGVLTAGGMLLEAACTAGWHGFFTRSVGAQIRGGEAAAMVRLAPHPIDCHSDCFDLLIGIDWNNAQRFEAEIPLAPHSLVIGDPRGGDPPQNVASAGARVAAVAFKDMIKAQPAWRANMIALGIAAKLIGLSPDAVRAVLGKRFGAKGPAAIETNLAAVNAGAAAAELDLGRSLTAPVKTDAKRWLISGNEAAALGAVRGGVRFAAAYPITPATDILEWLASNLARVGGVMLQAEDELASINMIIGASYGGTPALTATSGPGLSLMVEALGLATAAEIPIVVVDVMRGGPSTGIPTKAEQGDLNIAVYGVHGDAPRLVLAPQSVSDCVFTAQWSVYLAEALQVPAIVLSDQLIGQAQAAIERPADLAFIGERLRVRDIAAPYQRYALGGAGVSPMAIPGTLRGQYTADGLTHTVCGIPTGSASDHRAQLDKRRDKLETFNYGAHWATLEGEGELAVICWGSLTGVVREAIARARAEGVAVRLVAPRLIAPVRPKEMAAALTGVRKALIVEQSHGAQFHRYLKAHYELPEQVRVLHAPGPLPLRPGEIHRALMDWRNA